LGLAVCHFAAAVCIVVVIDMKLSCEVVVPKKTVGVAGL
jgi:hypothetical protein